MLPDRVSNPGPLTYESGALPIALRGPAYIYIYVYVQLIIFEPTCIFVQLIIFEPTCIYIYISKGITSIISNVRRNV